MLQLLSLVHGFAAPQPPFSGPFWNLASQATGPWDQYWWLFDWRDGGKSTCAPGHAKYQMAVVDGDASAVGACEEWWFAEGLGVVAIAKFPMLTYAGCRAVLAGTAPRGRPDSPDAQFAAYGDQMAGMAVLVDSCADDPTQCEACAWPGGGRGAGGECIGRK